MELNERVGKLEDEVKVIKNEVQAVLLDIRESYLNRENPFNPDVSSPTLHSVAAAISGPSNFDHDRRPSRPGEDSEETGTQPPRPAQKPSEEVPPEDKKVAIAEDTTAREEVSQAERSEQPDVTEVQDMNVEVNGHSKKNGKKDLATIAGLTRWVSGSVSMMGRTRTETVLDFAELAGHLTPDLKEVLVKFVARAPENGDGNGNGHSLKARDLLTSLVELETLLGMNSQLDEITLLTMVCQEVDP